MAYIKKGSDILLIEYDDVIRCTSYGILKFLITNKNTYKSVIKFEEFEDLDNKNLLRYCLQRVNKNILHSIMTKEARVEYDLDEMLLELETRDSIYFYKESSLDVYDLLSYFSSLQEVQSILIYSTDKHLAIPVELTEHLDLTPGNTPITYIYGDFMQCIEKYQPTSVMLSNLDYALQLRDTDMAVAISNTGYNMVYNTETKRFVIHPFIEHFSKEGFEYSYLTVKKLNDSYFD